ncbi:hypothetical protein EZJ43_16885 [Pedobacter changchengzhani]|uniref:Uncharacterized protein n=1 Tax=Pedobacter changchengzhani TaxID=2529274 RepID=A0A4R5MGY7_9SPHI|nr:hypothetical protein [Pedobacter changchengzhani]TDG34777.1 hypothetical protein EZJ43_16885 [Pedobacter changchengzhani]
MLDPFYMKVNGTIYEVVPEEGDTFTIFKGATEYCQVLRNSNKKWMRIDYKTDLPILEENKEVEDIGRLIDRALAKG